MIYVWLSGGQSRNPMIGMPTVLLCHPLAPNLNLYYTITAKPCEIYQTKVQVRLNL